MKKLAFLFLVNLFIHISHAQIDPQKIDLLFQHLCAEDSSLAYEAYTTLSETDYTLLKEPLAQFFSSTNNTEKVNKQFSRAFLEKVIRQLSKYSQYCREQNLSYKPSGYLNDGLKMLSQKTSAYRRYQTENALIGELSFNSISALEYYGILHWNDHPYYSSASVARMIDVFYSEHWKELLDDQQQLKHYLKKAELFAHLGIRGTCNFYLSKFNTADPYTVQKLQQLKDRCKDKDILKGIDRLLMLVPLKGDPENFKQYIRNLDILEYDELHLTIDTTDENYRFIVKKIRRASSERERNQLLTVLSQNPSYTMVPHLMKLISNKKIAQHYYRHARFVGGGTSHSKVEISVSDKVREILEELYHIYALEKCLNKNEVRTCFCLDDNTAHLGDYPEHWLRLWKEKKDSLYLWEKMIYHYQLSSLDTATNLSVYDLSGLFTSKFYKPEHRTRILSALKRTNPKYAELEDLTLAKGDSIFVADLPFIFDLPYGSVNHLYWNKFAAETWKSPQMIAYLKAKSLEFKEEKRDEFYASIFPELLPLLAITDTSFLPVLKTAVKKEYRYSDERYSNVDNWFPYSKVYALDTIGLPMEEKLRKVLMNPNKNIEYFKTKTLQQIDPVIVVDFLLRHKNEVNLKWYTLSDYISYTLGLWLPDNEWNTCWNMLALYDSIPRKDLYRYNLEKAGVHIFNEQQEPDLAVIYFMLRYDIIGEGFVGSTSRTNTLIPVFKLLEEKFHTQLGYPPYFEDYISHGNKDVLERAQDWIRYLETKGLVKPDPQRPASFQLFANE